ncbi:hypothetical protein [Pirellulimonas nuda]|nr:hypothetical protein [Pirellulimonas nuda]
MTLALVALTGMQSEASILVGTLPLVGTDDDNSQDKLSDIEAVIDAYNAAKDPDLIKPDTLFKKTDVDSAFVFNMANGFMFFSDMAGTMAVTTEAALTSLETAYFKYTGPESVTYYSVKAGKGFSLYVLEDGLNLLTRDDTTKTDISHVSFWTGDSAPVPEASTLAFWSLMFVGVAGAVYRKGRSTCSATA